MQSRFQLEGFISRVDPSTLPADRFEYVPDARNGKARCVVCGRTGYLAWIGPPPPVTRGRDGRNASVDERFDKKGRLHPWGSYFPYAPWQIACLLPHDWQCSCGLAFPTYVRLWRHIGGPRPHGWGRPERWGDHRFEDRCDLDTW